MDPYPQGHISIHNGLYKDICVYMCSICARTHAHAFYSISTKAARVSLGRRAHAHAHASLTGCGSRTRQVGLKNMAAPSADTRLPPLLTDLYHFTMAYAYWRAGRDRETAVFELFFRENPFGGGFTLFAGLNDCLRFLRSFRFGEDGEELGWT